MTAAGRLDWIVDLSDATCLVVCLHCGVRVLRATQAPAIEAMRTHVRAAHRDNPKVLPRLDRQRLRERSR